MTNAELHAALITEGSDFARSLAASLTRYGRLSDKQMYWANRLACPKPTVESIDFTAVVALIAKARAKGAKRVSLNFATHGGIEVKYASGGKNAGGLWVTDGKPFGQNRLYGSVAAGSNDLVLRRDVMGISGLLDALKGIATDPIAAAVESGRVTGCCCFCSRTLTDAGSVEHGYGPTCAEKYGLPWESKTNAEFIAEAVGA